ncbi:hypothetical protein U0M97_00725 [Streptomyces venezuelae]|uniref:hypothetical protein n=1 Tax=Streptomyces gardneri TaxID=66892 RepID=UPI001E4E21F7|nr:hypothetical protein [Streptomyces gardneri]WRK34538.1 hypothetical protein U0M97_00725 [Streptomyces venezuelae]
MRRRRRAFGVGRPRGFSTSSVWYAGTDLSQLSFDATSLEVIKGFYDGLFHTTVPVSGTREAERAKLIENTFRFVNPEAARSAARLLVADVRGRGSACPDEFVAWELTVNDHGRLWLPGIGMPVNYPVGTGDGVARVLRSVPPL